MVFHARQRVRVGDPAADRALGAASFKGGQSPVRQCVIRERETMILLRCTSYLGRKGLPKDDGKAHFRRFHEVSDLLDDDIACYGVVVLPTIATFQQGCGGDWD